MQCRYCKFETNNHLEIGDHHLENHRDKPFNPAWYDDEYEKNIKIPA